MKGSLFSLFSLAILIFCFCLDTKAQSNQNPIIIVIDPGHGGEDSGRPSSSTHYYHEKDINLQVAKQLASLLKERIPYVKILLTRQKDIALSLKERVAFANDNKAHFFISLHCNASSSSTKIIGSSSHIHSYQNAKSYSLARHIEEQLTRGGRKSIGVKDATERGYSLYVTKYTKMPSVLVEMGFLTNSEEEHYLNSAIGQKERAEGLYRGVLYFLKQSYPQPYDVVAVVETTGQKTTAKTHQNVMQPVNYQQTEVKMRYQSYYSVQVRASKEPIQINSNLLKQKGYIIWQYLDEEANTYPYKYLVGKISTREEANRLAEEIQEMGFPDAFVVEFFKEN